MLLSSSLPPRLRLHDETGQPKPHRSDFCAGDEFYRSFDLTLSMGKKTAINFPGATLKLPEASCDWSRIALLHDRWRYKPHQGIVRVVWRELSDQLIEFGGDQFFFKCRHDPTDEGGENYAHCLLDAHNERGQTLGSDDVQMSEVENREVRQQWARYIFPVERDPMPPAFAHCAD